jgi:plastocyanin
MISATVSLASAAPSIAGAAFPALLSVGAVLGLVASVARVRNASPRAVPAAAVVAFVLGVGLSVAVPAAGAGAAKGQQGDLRVYARDTKFEPDDLVANAGDIGVVFKNDDLFWHTFTVSDLDANVTVATAGKRRLVMRDVPAGTYKVVCAIPGHESAGMTATLVVR